MSKVFVIGGANVDIKAKTTGPHIAATSNPGHVNITAGGVARNIAHNLARCGADVALLSIVGNDANAEFILNETSKAGVDITFVQRTQQPTGTYMAVLNNNGELITAVNDMRLLDVQILQSHIAQISAAKMIVADCNLDYACLELLDHEKLVIEPVSVPKSLRLLALLKKRNVYLATPNLDQIEALTGTREPRTAAEMLHKLGLQNIVIHAGSQGAFVSNGKDFTHIPSQAKIIKDVTGAGDAATAGLVYGLQQNLSLEKAAEFGQMLAARVIASTASTLG